MCTAVSLLIQLVKLWHADWSQVHLTPSNNVSS